MGSYGHTAYGWGMDLSLEGGMWRRGGPLPGADNAGFGSVFEATGPDDEQVVAKFVAKVPGASRELLIGDALSVAGAPHVVPILDQGEHDDAWVLIMPRASTSLKRYFHDHGRQLDLGEVIQILTDVATGLDAIGETVVHRDLKPANVLLLDEGWALADFGIARYVEATTDDETRKYSMTAPYAAPEQFKFERATPATDVYAFGVMAYELVSGDLPFPGPSRSDFHDQHVRETPPPLTAGTARLRTLIEECLMKRPEARPRAANVHTRLLRAAVEPSGAGSSRLAQVNQAEVARRLKAESEQQVEQDRAEREAQLFQAAEQKFSSFWEPLRESIQDEAPAASVELNARGPMLFVAELAGAKLGVSRPQKRSWHGPFTAIADAVISVSLPRQNSLGWVGRSHSLWYCDPFEENVFGWHELAFMASGFSPGRPAVEPYSQPAGSSPAFERVIGTEQLAWPVELLGRDDPAEFLERWLGWFADAAAGTLARPSSMPEKPIHQHSWREQ